MSEVLLVELATLGTKQMSNNHNALELPEMLEMYPLNEVCAQHVKTVRARWT